MKSTLYILVLSVLLISCGAKTKITDKNKTQTYTEESTKENTKSQIESKKDSTRVIKSDEESFDIIVEPTIKDSTDKSQKEVIVQTPSGKISKITYPSNTKITLNTSNKTKEESKTSTDNTKSDITNTLESNIKKDSLSQSRNVSSVREEPKSFNITLALGITFIIVLLLVFVYLKYKKIL